MPGMSLTTAPESDGFGSLLLDGRYELTIYADQPALKIGSTAYPEYPITTYKIDGTTVIVEGAIYNRSDDRLRGDLTRLARLVFDESPDLASIKSICSNLDGDFILVFKKKDKVSILNDIFGRLPLFYGARDGDYTVSRHKEFFRSHGYQTPDRLAVAQYLCFGYVLAGRTLTDGVSRLRPGSLLQIQDGIETHQYHRLNLDRDAHTDKSITENAKALTDLFLAACERRAGLPQTDLVSLSGGLDSRCVLAGFDRLDHDYLTATRDNENDSRADIEIARELANAMGAEWNRIECDDATGVDLTQQLRAKGCSVPLNVGYHLNYYRSLIEEHGTNIAYHTGDGGDKIFPDISPPRKPSNITGLCEIILENDSRLESTLIQSLTEISEKEIVKSVFECVKSYPEEDLTKRYQHFLFDNRAANWLFEGEDINRCYFWSVTPFYDHELFEYAMSCPSGQKRYGRLFRAFLQELSPTAASIPNANYGVPPSSLRHPILLFGESLFFRYPKLMAPIIPIARAVIGQNSNTDIPETFMSVLESYAATDLPGIDTDSLNEILNGTQHSRKQLYYILTSLGYLDLLSNGSTRLETEYGHNEFW